MFVNSQTKLFLNLAPAQMAHSKHNFYFTLLLPYGSKTPGARKSHPSKREWVRSGGEGGEAHSFTWQTQPKRQDSLTVESSHVHLTCICSAMPHQRSPSEFQNVRTTRYQRFNALVLQRIRETRSFLQILHKVRVKGPRTPGLAFLPSPCLASVSRVKLQGMCDPGSSCGESALLCHCCSCHFPSACISSDCGKNRPPPLFLLPAANANQCWAQELRKQPGQVEGPALRRPRTANPHKQDHHRTLGLWRP